MTSLAGKFGNEKDNIENIIDAGVCVELIHIGSLYHDDVIDNATTRRGVESSNSKWSSTLSILAGDYLLCLLYTSPSPRDATLSRMPSSA